MVFDTYLFGLFKRIRRHSTLFSGPQDTLKPLYDCFDPEGSGISKEGLLGIWKSPRNPVEA